MLFLGLLILFQSLFQNNDVITKEIIKLLNKNLGNDSKFSITFFSTNKKEFIIKINSDIPLIPASTNKLFTTGMALMNLGKDFTIDTEIYTDDKDISDGIINGNLYLKGFGDPTITTSDYRKLIKDLTDKKIQAITGNIIVDDSFFEETFQRNEWIENENITVPLPLISAVTINGNSIELKITGQSIVNKPGIVSLENDLDYFEIINKTKTTKSKTQLSISSKFESGKEKITISGTIKQNSSKYLKLYIANPTFFAGNLIKKLLRENGISFWGEIKPGVVPKLSNRIAIVSTPLVELLKPINKNSNNFFAEHLFLIIGGQYSNGDGSPFDASQAIITTLKSLNIYNSEFNMVDGSGISRKNQFSTKMLVEFLYQIYLNPLIFNEFYNSLSIPQSDGTLKHRFSNLIPPYRLRGKTGTLNGVVSLAGYVTAKSGDLLIFSINFNYSRGNANKLRMLQDKIITLIADSN